MTKEIVEAVGVLEREKGISADRLMAALEDALLSAYKKTPGAAKYARVEVDRSSGDFRVYELLLPPDLEEQLLDEVEEEAGEPTVDPETGEMVYPEPEVDQQVGQLLRNPLTERKIDSIRMVDEHAQLVAPGGFACQDLDVRLGGREALLDACLDGFDLHVA